MSDSNSEPNGRALAGVAGSGGSVAETGSDGLGKLMSRAEEEARLRGRGIVHPHDLALALTVTPDVAELLLRCGVLQQDWRDYINFILGVNEGARRARERTVGERVLFAEHRYTGATELSESAQLLLADADEMARQVATSVTVEHVLMACMMGHGGIAGGTLRYFGMTPARLADALPRPMVRRNAGIRSDTRPRGVNPVLLFGGGMQDLPVVQVHTALREAGRNPDSFTVVGITAATGTKSAALSLIQRWSQLPGCVRTLASISDRAGAHETHSVQELLEADLVLLDGGQEVRLFDALAGTPAEAALVAACDAGVVLAGYSAGTSALGIGSLSDWCTV